MFANLLTYCAISFGSVAATANETLASGRTLVIAHRGDSENAPENTMPSFLAGVRSGADLVEMDVHRAADGTLVCVHDSGLGRTTDADETYGWWSSVRNLTGTQLRQLDAGSWFDVQFRGERIPTLAEGLETISGQSIALVERKSGSAEEILEVIREQQMCDRVVVLAYDLDFLADMHRLAPKIPLAALAVTPLTDGKLDRIEDCGAEIVVLYHRFVGCRQIEEAHDRGMKLWAWTVNDLDDVEELLEDGVDGLVTNDPNTIIPLVRRHEVA